MRTNATPDEIVARIITLGKTVPGMVDGFGDIGDIGILPTRLPAFVVLIGRVLSDDDYAFGVMQLVQEYILLQHLLAIDGDTRDGDDGRAGVMAYLAPTLAVFRSNPRLAHNGDGGIVAHSVLKPDGIPRRFIRDRGKQKRWGLVYRLRVTTYVPY